MMSKKDRVYRLLLQRADARRTEIRDSYLWLTRCTSVIPCLLQQSSNQSRFRTLLYCRLLGKLVCICLVSLVTEKMRSPFDWVKRLKLRRVSQHNKKERKEYSRSTYFYVAMWHTHIRTYARTHVVKGARSAA